ncbi:protein of unknown function [Thiomonas sp. X19]|uniref:hypothetical protein n=1 Tax=Thiomonas sp. X19 TaxID=1050370 RepID=UPI000B6804C2|nr:hypothetical protein [Thiomonas sp. X19]SCC95955.1 protein of unknown function [Thiomonas sp. X19]
MVQPNSNALSHALDEVLTGVKYLTHNATSAGQYPSELQRNMHLKLLAGKLSESVLNLVDVAAGETATEAAAAAMQEREMAFTKANAQAQADGAEPSLSPAQKQWQNKGDACWTMVLSRTRERDLGL